MKKTIAALMISAGASAAQAHGVWLAERAGELAIVYGVGPQDEAYRSEKIKTVSARAGNGDARPAKIIAREKNALIDAPKDAAVLTVMMDNGFWTKGEDGKYVNASKSTVPNPQTSSHSIKFNTHVRASTGGALKPSGGALEITPLVNVHILKVGADIPVQVLFEGKPLANVALFPDYVNDANARSVKTDADGKAVLFVRNNGLNVIGVSHNKPTPDNKDADRIGYFATLSFVIAFSEE